MVAAFEDKDWKTRYTHPTSGGNWSSLVVTHEGGAALAAVSGMTPTHSRVFDIRTGKIRAGDKTEGMYSLAVLDGETRILGIREQRLTVMDAETHATLFIREEGPGGSAWLTRDGVRVPAPGFPPPPADPVHLIHDGWSAPIDSFDPWLYDPLGLGTPSLSALPELPVIVSVTAVHAGPDAKGLGRFKAMVRSKEPLIGAVLTLADGSEAFLEFAAVPESLDGPAAHLPRWIPLPALPLGWGRMRLVAESGVLSRPHLSGDGWL